MDEEHEYCRACLATGVKMHSFNKLIATSDDPIGIVYAQLAQIPMQEIGENQYVCVECASLLQKFQNFKSRCLLAHNILSIVQVELQRITKEDLDVNRKHYELESPLSYSSLLVVDVVNNNITQHDIDNKIKEEVTDIDKNDIKPDLSEMDVCDDETFLDDEQYLIKVENDTTDLDFDDQTEDTTEYLEEYLDLDESSNDKEDSTIDPPVVDIKPVTKKKKVITKNRDNKLTIQKIQSVVKQYNTFSSLKEFFKIETLSVEEQKNEVMARKKTNNYLYSTYKCDLCFRGYGDVSAFNNHMAKHSEEQGNFECDICLKRFGSYRQLLRHCSTHGKKFSCKQCSVVCYETQHAKIHAHIHIGIKFTCEICGEQFNVKHSMLMHKRLKHLDLTTEEYICELCGDKFGTPKGRDIHTVRVHSLEKNEKLGPVCAECDIHFSSQAAYKRHLVLSSKHTVSNGCKVCGETFPTEEELKQHMRKHAWKAKNIKYSAHTKPINCTVCGLKLSSRTAVSSHMRSQHPENSDTDNLNKYIPWVCEFCGKTLSSAAHLATHRRKHTGERPFPCTECDKRFAHRMGLDAHVSNVHKGVRYTCEVCARIFTVYTALLKHIKAVHDNIRPHVCELCNKAFVYPCELKTHHKHAHEKVPYPKKKKKVYAEDEETSVQFMAEIPINDTEVLQEISIEDSEVVEEVSIQDSDVVEEISIQDTDVGQIAYQNFRLAGPSRVVTKFHPKSMKNVRHVRSRHIVHEVQRR